MSARMARARVYRPTRWDMADEQTRAKGYRGRLVVNRVVAVVFIAAGALAVSGLLDLQRD
jgi:cytochrome c-type biogenesis protein CcmH/NrfG